MFITDKEQPEESDETTKETEETTKSSDNPSEETKESSRETSEKSTEKATTGTTNNSKLSKTGVSVSRSLFIIITVFVGAGLLAIYSKKVINIGNEEN